MGCCCRQSHLVCCSALSPRSFDFPMSFIQTTLEDRNLLIAQSELTAKLHQNSGQLESDSLGFKVPLLATYHGELIVSIGV